MKVDLIDGSCLDFDQIKYICHGREELTIHFLQGDPVTVRGENFRRVKCAMRGKKINPKDITPDDIAHIKPVGMSFAAMLKWFRGES
tara:strand:+ start:315 stop:575 length:261 start_codon:yes stop_codon:yes gene_type:complete